MRNSLFEESRLVAIPCFTKQNLKIYFSGKVDALNERLKRGVKKGDLLKLKNGLYVTIIYFLKETDKTSFKEYVASRLRFPSYLSMEYVLSKCELLTEATYIITSVTTKTSRTYSNFLGTYKYSKVKDQLYFGFETVKFYKNQYFIATKAKALCDMLYLKRNLLITEEEIMSGLRINWENFFKDDLDKFKEYVTLSGSNKMKAILKILERNL